ncbi:MAG TPA: YceI family protein [Albitalea sp.]
MDRFSTALLLAAAAGAPATPHLVPEGSEVVFTSRQMGVPVDGRFRRFDAQVAFDPRQPAAARIAVDVDLASVSIGTAEIEAELAKPEWFDTRAHPRASFRSTAVKPLGGARFEVTGTLAMKGVAREVAVPVTLAPAGAHTTATGAFTVKRTDYRIGEGEWGDTSLVADEVRIRFALRLAGLPAP